MVHSGHVKGNTLDGDALVEEGEEEGNKEHHEAEEDGSSDDNVMEDRGAEHKNHEVAEDRAFADGVEGA